jgi:hypothetical protein
MLKISQSVNNFSKVIRFFPLCDPCNHVAKCSKAWQTNGKLRELWGARLAAVEEDFSPEGAQDDSLEYEECCKNPMNPDERMAIPDFPAKGPDHISFCPPGGIFCI